MTARGTMGVSDSIRGADGGWVAGRDRVVVFMVSFHNLDFFFGQTVEVMDEAVNLRARESGGVLGKGKCAAAAKA